MRRARIALPLLLLLSSLASAAPVSGPEPDWVDEAREGARQLQIRLGAALTGALNEGGPKQAVQVCRLRAPEIARDVSGSSVRIARTALRTRNPGNAPDTWETRVLEDFQARIAAGADPGALETWAVEDKPGIRTGRWMRAIPTTPMCTTCHGNHVEPALLETIRELYPEDQATGFEVGQMRGAFTVTVDLSETE